MKQIIYVAYLLFNLIPCFVFMCFFLQSTWCRFKRFFFLRLELWVVPELFIYSKLRFLYLTITNICFINRICIQQNVIILTTTLQGRLRRIT